MKVREFNNLGRFGIKEYCLSLKNKNNKYAEYEEPCGQIRFNKSRKRKFIKSGIKSLVIILVAALSGAIAGAYVVEKKYVVSSGINNQSGSASVLGSTADSGVKTPKNTISKVVETVGPTVVGISADIENFNNRTINENIGSGIVIRDDGVIITNYHIVGESKNIYVKLPGEDTEPIKASIISVDKAMDVAIIKIETTGLPKAKFGDSSKVRVGDVAVAIGNPLGEETIGTVTQGIISAVNKKISIKDIVSGNSTTYKIIHTDTNINMGNTGGPLCNELGEVIAINNVIFSNYAKDGDAGFALPSNDVKVLIDKALNGEENVVLGIEGSNYVDNDVIGIYIRQVYLGAAKAGILPTDILLEVNGVKVEKLETVKGIIKDLKPGDKVICNILRENKNMNFEVELQKKEE